MDDVARAVVPGHVTAFLAVERGEDPTETGSTGAGICLDDGVTVGVRPARETSVLLDGDPVDVPAVERVLDVLSVTAEVRAVTPLPIHSGFGVTGAMALGTALAVNDLFERGLSENELASVAHGAEVQAGSGLGDVVSQTRGGVPVRLEAGDPHHGKLDGVPARGRIEYVAFGERDLEAVVGGDADRLAEPAQRALSRVVREPTGDQLLYAARTFAREADLLTDPVGRAVADVGDAGGEAAVALPGESVFALGTGLSDAGYDPSVCSIHPTGATLLE